MSSGFEGRHEHSRIPRCAPQPLRGRGGGGEEVKGVGEEGLEAFPQLLKGIVFVLIFWC